MELRNPQKGDTLKASAEGQKGRGDIQIRESENDFEDLV